MPFTMNSIGLKTTDIQGKNITDACFFGVNHKCGIGKIHGSVFIFSHEKCSPGETCGGLRNESRASFKEKFDACTLCPD